MDSLLFAIGAVAPIVLMVSIGYLLKRIGFMSADFARAANKLVFRVFLPSMLFLNVYRIENLAQMDFSYVLYTVAVLLVIFSLSIPAVLCITRRGDRRGVLIQASFRSNYALIGIPLASSLFGEAGSIVATLLSAVVIPMLNVLAVVSLTVFREQEGKRPSVKSILLGIAKNPLIQSVLLGIVMLGLRAMFVEWGVSFRLSDVKPLFTVLSYLSNLATPLALLVLGAQFEFSAVPALKKELIYGILVRVLVVPLIGVGTAYLLFANRFSGAHFAAFVAMFCTPVAVSSVPMAQERGGDTVLAGQLVIWTTLFSALTVFIASFLLRAVGIFA